MGRTCQLLALAGIITAATVATANATFIPPWFADLYDDQLATYNTALFPAGPPEQEERTDILIQQLRRSSADVFCLQEVWLTETQRKVYQGVKDRYPYVVSNIDLMQDSSNDTTPACSISEFQLLAACSVTHSCTNPTNLVTCLFQNCQSVLRQLTQPCLYCLLIGVRGQQCLTDSVGLHGETFGLMFLSKKRLTDVKVKPFQEETTRLRAFIQATVNGIGEVICTHLTTPDIAPFYGGPPFTDPFLFSSYAEQQYNEVLKLFNEIEDLQTPIIMGDFNHGPASPGVTWDLPIHYGLMNARGFVSPYVLYDGRCTFCVANPFVARQGFTEDHIIDHVYVPTNMLNRVKAAKRIFDNISTTNGTRLSDHYGIQVTLKKNYRGRSRGTSGLLPLPPPQMDLDKLCTAASD